MAKKILLVDDDRFILQLICRALGAKGFSCRTAKSVHEALGLLYDEIPDIVLSDYSMPEIDGFEFRKVLLRDKRYKNIPFVFYTSFADEDTMQKGLEMQAVDYIDKNTPVHLVVSKLNNILDTIRKQHEKSLFEIGAAAEALNLRSVPLAAPTIEGFKLQFLYQTYNHYPGGDFIDFIKTDENTVFVILGDVMGKKWGAWFFSFNFLSYIRSAIRLCVFDGISSPASILNKINRIVCLDPVLGDVLSTLSLMMIDQSASKVYYAGAGDLPVIHFSKADGNIACVQSAGLLLGIMENGLYQEDVLEMHTGDQLIAITDGMIDFMTETGKTSDYTLFVRKLERILGQSDTYKEIKDQMFSATEDESVVDDRSIVIIEKI
ncbi:sigma-B regulation protein RsbU (phosphoserine phosphatase) [Arcticibacter pallidicorallinus]|uniref:Sigma-B regulation protein RsbU (Phosphoserine phosphatase) n=1 Tax=Arcticibacter pallidicorallinus TaxID=1259464 RepID=A0A2T0U3H5_9SPHI|nr:fused response regulator/phosphatase [Arcticibacter pallidicorallinus]PRY52418.1 sigma-B regulation protein RsbU (phosphoserine phosphatase) [Arcticibacter pallidicorallinus]